MNREIQEKLLNCGFLDKLRDNKKYNNVKESKNFIAVFENYVFVWHDHDSCILAAEISTRDKSNTIVKTLNFSNPPVFEVDSIIFNHTGTLIALNGKNGVMIFEVPWRYGKFGTFGSEENTIIGRSWNIAECFLVCSNRTSISQVSWHPGSASNTHLTILSSDNYIRTYDVTDPQAPIQAVNLGINSRSNFLSSESKITFSSCLGENAVSFDFGPPEKIQVPQLNRSKVLKSMEGATVWPIYILHGNGDVYILKDPLGKNRYQTASKVQGPLTMYPQTEDNYGYDSCCILCLHSIPNCLVIATTAGVLYHCIALENPESFPGKEVRILSSVLDQPMIVLPYNLYKLDSSWEYITPDDCEVSLYVFESVELPLSLTEEQDSVYSHSIRLYKDITSQTKYHCSHASGLHSVAVPFLNTLEKQLENEDLENIFNKDSIQESIVEYMVCTKPLSAVNAVPMLGLDIAFSDAGASLICFLASIEFVCLPLVSSYFSSTPSLLFESHEAKSSLVIDQTFERQIQKTLQRSVCSPFVKSSSRTTQNNSTPKQWLDLLCNVTQRYREDYIQRLTTARSLLRSRIKVLTKHKENQLRDIDRVKQESVALKTVAGNLAERYEEAKTNQENLMNRIEVILQKLQKSTPYHTKAEICMKEDLISYEEKVKMFESSLELMKKKLKNLDEKMKEAGDQAFTSQEESNKLNLNDNQVKHIKEILVNESNSIAELKKNVTALKKQVWE